MHLGDRKNVHESFEEEILGGVITIMLEGAKEVDTDELYYTSMQASSQEKTLGFISYYTWANRSQGEMVVWIND